MRRPPRPKGALLGIGRARGRGGFTLLEMVLVVTIIALIAGTLLPILTRPFIVDQRIDTAREMYAIVDAIQGRPDLGFNGFARDLGRLPLNALNQFGVDELYVQGTVANPPAALNLGGIPSGWNGPYLMSFSQLPDTDAWGTPYLFTRNPSDATQWRITSYGPDRVAGNDDIVLPDSDSQSWFQTAGALTIDLFLQRQGQIVPLPSTNLVTVDSGGTPTAVQPTIYLPSTADGSIVACTGATPGGGCPGSCTVVDADDAAVSASLKTPYHIRCRPIAGGTGIPFGVHRLTFVPSSDPSSFLANDTGSPRTFETNVVVDRGVSYQQVVVAPNSAANSTTLPYGTAFGFSFASTPLSVSTTTKTTFATGSGIVSVLADSAVPVTPLYLALKVAGTVKVVDPTAICTVSLSTASPFPTGAPPPPNVVVQPYTSVVTGPTGALIPFSFDYVMPLKLPAQPAGSTFDLSALLVQLQSGAAGVTCQLVDVDGSVTKVFAP
jgi:prepilin-type N-terminal cleavage/methylation domain-containing protein